LLFAYSEKTYYLPREEREKRTKRREIQKIGFGGAACSQNPILFRLSGLPHPSAGKMVSE
jgi:hypothetical protein